MLCGQHLEISLVIACILCRRKVAVVRTLDKHFQPGKHGIFAGVNAQHKKLTADAVILGRVSDVGYIHTAAAFDCPNVAVFPLFAKSDDLIREMSAAVHAGRTDGKLCAIPLLPCGGKEIVKVSPYLAPFQVAVNTLVSDAPAFLADTPAHDFRLKAVVLGINAASQVENAVGHLGLVELAAVDQGGGFYRFARFLPRQTQVRVHEDLHLLVVAPGSVQISRNEFLDDLIPAAER